MSAAQYWIARLRGHDSESGARLAVVPIHVSNSGRAFAFSRRISPEFCFSRVLAETKGAGEGRAAGLGTRKSAAPQKITHGWTTGLRRIAPAFPAANGFNGVLRALPGEPMHYCPPSPHGWLMRASGRTATSPQDLTHRPRASGPHDFSVRARLRWESERWRVLAPEAMRRRCQRQVVCARAIAHGVPPCNADRAPTPSRPSLPGLRFVTIAIRPLSQARVFRMYDKSEFR
uniref:Uncharacterized protein n=1 Tax=Bradyrhizobium japonicum TaxID=375 RepID=Q9RH63_BRAJP|nr:hypothetical protein [Bradyrhizobium japonicum]